MHIGDEALDRPDEVARHQPVDPVQLIGPAHAAAGQLPAPHAESSDPLGLRHPVGVLAQRLLDHPPPRDVAEQHEQGVVAGEAAALEPPSERRVVAGVRHRSPVAHCLLERAQERLARVSVGELAPDAAAQQLVARAAEHGGGGQIDVAEAPVRVQHGHPVGDAIQHRHHFRLGKGPPKFPAHPPLLNQALRNKAQSPRADKGLVADMRT